MNLIAHRGLQSKNSRENTLEAILLANKNSLVDGVEIDVRLTKDNQLVVIHDEFIDRVSDGRGKVSDMSLERLRRFNYGSRIKPSTINTLKEVLDKFEPGTFLIIELKTDENKESLLVSKVLETIKNYPDLKIWLQSSNELAVNYLKRNGHCTTGIVINKMNQSLLDMDVSFYSLEECIVTKDMVREKIDSKKQVLVWTITCKKQMEQLKEKVGNYLDKIYIISNNPIMYCSSSK